MVPFDRSSCSRRTVLKSLATLGVGSVAFRRSLAAQVEQQGDLTTQMIADAEWIAGIDLTDEERDATLRAIRGLTEDMEQLRKVQVDYADAPCLVFDPAPWIRKGTELIQRGQATLIESHPPSRPASDEQIAFLPVTELASLIRTRQITSLELTKIYLDRLRRFDEQLKCVVTLTEATALERAAQADREIAAGSYRGPLHGIPWGAKDLIAYPGYPTTWGAPPFRSQQLDQKATVARHLEAAGAVLVAKLSLGALAQGDRWFGGMTRNPWNTDQGSSGSSAGSASAVVAGLVGFAIGSETLGSIVSPCIRCGATGLRPTFGRVSRYGCMALSWTMDKLGPICRSVEDCAIVLDAIHGWDGKDAAAVDMPFAWPARRDVTELLVGFERTEQDDAQRSDLQLLRQLGVKLVPIELPKDLPVWAITLMLGTEAGAVFDPLTRAHVTEGLNSWPATFRRAQFVPAVEYLRASRVRGKLMSHMREMMQNIDLYVSSSDLGITNLTGHPSAVVPIGYDEKEGKIQPRTMTITGSLYGETDLLNLALGVERLTGANLRHPPLA